MANSLLSTNFEFFDELCTLIQVQEFISSVFDDKKPKWADIEEEEVVRLLDEVEELQKATFDRLAADDTSVFRDSVITELDRLRKQKADNEHLTNELRTLEAAAAPPGDTTDTGNVTGSGDTNREPTLSAVQPESDVNRNHQDVDELHDESTNSSFANIDALRENEMRLRAGVVRRERQIAVLRSRIDADTARERELTHKIGALRTPESVEKRAVAAGCCNLIVTLFNLFGVREVAPSGSLREQTFQLAFQNDVRVTFEFDASAAPALREGAVAMEQEKWFEQLSAGNWKVRVIAVEPWPANRNSRLAALASVRGYAPLLLWIVQFNAAIRADLH